jgi:hypothetical protein
MLFSIQENESQDDHGIDHLQVDHHHQKDSKLILVHSLIISGFFLVLVHHHHIIDQNVLHQMVVERHRMKFIEKILFQVLF